MFKSPRPFQPQIHLLLIVFVLLTALIVVRATPVQGQTVNTACPDPAALQASQEKDIVAAVNNARAAANMNPVTVNALLDAASQRQSNDMASKDFLDHTGSDGSDPSKRASDAGYNWSNIGENILYRMDMNAAGAFDQWWNSPPHKANMMNPAFTEIGVTFACTPTGGKYYYTMVLAAPLSPGNAPAADNASGTAVPTDVATAAATDTGNAAPAAAPSDNGAASPTPTSSDEAVD